MKKTFVTILSSDSYLVGVLVLFASLQKQSVKYPLLVLISRNVSNDSLFQLKKNGINFKNIPEIQNPHIKDSNHIFNSAFDKLNIFNLIEFDKIVYIDADILVVDNIDELFESPSISAVNSGGGLPNTMHWTQLNAGMLVIKPNQKMYHDMISKVSLLPSKDGSDQGFLQSYFPDWENEIILHLDQGYNMFSGFLNQFHHLFFYDFAAKTPRKVIKMIHFWGDNKPWIRGREAIIHLYGLEAFANTLWWKTYDQIFPF